jgi:hypothetical protein
MDTELLIGIPIIKWPVKFNRSGAEPMALD